MSIFKQIVFTGGTGRFGKIFRKINSDKKYVYPTKKELNITSLKSVENYIKRKKPKTLIHAAGLSRPMKIHEKNIMKSIDKNII